jgi:DNA-binding transcriptional LysR family regulator
VWPGDDWWRRTGTWAEPAGRVAQWATEMTTIVGLVSAGAGIALVPAVLRHVHQDGVTYRPLHAGGDPPCVRLGLAWRANGESPLVERFLAVARAAGPR